MLNYIFCAISNRFLSLSLWKILHLTEFFTQPAVVMVDIWYLTNIRCEPNLVNNPETSSILSSTQICFSAFGASSIQFQVCCLSLTWNILVGPWKEHFCYNFCILNAFLKEFSVFLKLFGNLVWVDIKILPLLEGVILLFTGHFNWSLSKIPPPPLNVFFLENS